MKDNFFKYLFSLLFIIYITLFFSSATGFYEYKNREKKNMTEAGIKKFEQDIKNGTPIDLNNYIDTNNNNYQNNFSNFGKNISNIISNGVSKTVGKSFSLLIKFVEQ